MKDLLHTILLEVFQRASYVIMIALTLATAHWAWVRGRELGFSWSAFWKIHSRDAILAAVAVGLTFAAVPPRYRLLSDESNLLSVSQSMLRDQTPKIVYSQKTFYRLESPVGDGIPNRPLLFPFLVTILHLLTGERAANAYAVNGIILWATLCFFMIFFRNRGSRSAGLVVCALFLAHPIVVYCATSAGFDLLALFVWMVAAAAFMSLIDRPSSAGLALFLCLLGLYAECRYESVAIAAFLAIGALGSSEVRAQFKTPKVRIALLIAAAALIPLVVQQALLINRFYLPHAQGAPFTPGDFAKHTIWLLTFLFNFEWEVWVPTSFLAIWCGILAAMGLVWKILREVEDPKRNPPPHHARLKRFVPLASWMILNILYLAHYAGEIASLSQTRFFISMMAGFAFFPGLLWVELSETARRAAILIALAILVVDHAASPGQRYTNMLYTIRETEKVRELIPGSKNNPPLIIHMRPNIFTTYGYSSLDFFYMNLHTDEMLEQIRNKLYPHVYVVQPMDYLTHTPQDNSDLTDRFQLRKIAEFELSGERFVRVSEIVPPPPLH